MPGPAGSAAMGPGIGKCVADIAIGANGAWHWARPRPDLEDFLRRYFIGRAEDG